MSHEFLDFVEDILDAMDKAEVLVEGFTYHAFEEDFRTNFAVIRALEIIGEVTKRLPMSVREQYREIPWTGMAGMRDRWGSINVTLDGCCDHRAILPDEELHRHASENLEQADALLFGRVTYEMEAAWRAPARPGARPD